MENSFDHLTLLLSGKNEIRCAYEAGKEDGKSEERGRFERLFIEMVTQIGKRRSEFEKKVMIRKELKKWYIEGIGDAIKILWKKLESKT